MAGVTIRQIAEQMYSTCPELRWITLDPEGVKGWKGSKPRWSGGHTSGFWVGVQVFSMAMNPSSVMLPPTFKVRNDRFGRPDFSRMLWEAPIDRIKVADDMAQRSWSTTRRHKVKAVGDGIDIIFDSYDHAKSKHQFEKIHHSPPSFSSNGSSRYIPLVPGTGSSLSMSFLT